MRQATLTSVAVLLAIAISAPSASADPSGLPIDVITVPGTGGTVSSSISLDAGAQYYLLAEGTYIFESDTSPPLEADAEWWFTDGWNEIGSPPDSLDILIDGGQVDWRGYSLASPNPVADYSTYAEHVFSPSHTYWQPYIGTGQPVDFHIWDTFTGDNQGSLTVSIYVPEPATLSLLALGGLLATGRRR